MRVVELDPSDPRVPKTPWGDASSVFTPDLESTFLGVEDQDGRLIGGVILARMPHAEGFWIDQAAHGHAGAGVLLYRAVREVLARWHASTLVSVVGSDKVERALTAIGARTLPGVTMVRTFEDHDAR